VGFEIYNLGSQEQSSFKVFFNLWGRGGPNWLVEEKKFYKEQANEWTEVIPKSSKNSVFSRISYAQKVASIAPRVSVFDRLATSRLLQRYPFPNRIMGHLRKTIMGSLMVFPLWVNGIITTEPISRQIFI
jgi:hypothetical protein